MTGLDIDVTPCRHARAAAAAFAERTALVDGGRRWTFAGAWDAAGRLAAGLRAGGLASGDRVALWMANCAEMVLASWALEIAGLVRVPLNARYTAIEAARILADCAPALVVADREHAAALGAGAPPVVVAGDARWQALAGHVPGTAGLHAAGPDEPCSISYTSGSTGAAKGVVLTHRAWAAVYRNMLVDRDIRADDRLAHFGPLSHASGAYVLPFFLRGAASVISPPAAGLDGLLDTLARERCTVLTCVPTVLARLLAHPRLATTDLSALRAVGYGGEPLPPNTLRAAVARFGPVLTGNYGLTEAMMTCCVLPPAEHFTAAGEPRAGAIGRPYRHVEVVLRAPDGAPVPRGEVGEITVRSPHVMRGYWNRPEETARVLRDGWLWTGDLAREDADGILRLAGRSKDMLICGGFNIWPQEVEAALAGAPGVREVAVLGVPDPDWGEIAVAFVAGAAPDAAALAAWAKPRLGLRTPKRWVLVDELPRTAVGKADKAALRARLAAADGAATAGTGATGVDHQ